MTDLNELTIAGYQAIIAPLLMMTCCATLVWALQNRFSRVVHAIRTLVSEGKRDNIDYTHSLSIQIHWLKGRSFLLRNAIAAFYFAMCCFLLAAIFIAIVVVAGLPLELAIVSLFLIGLALACVALACAIVESSRSFDSLKEEVDHR